MIEMRRLKKCYFVIVMLFFSKHYRLMAIDLSRIKRIRCRSKSNSTNHISQTIQLCR